MKKIPRSLAVLFLLVLPHHAFPATQNVLAFTHATVIDTTGGPVQRDTTVLINGDRIAAIGESKDLKPPPDATVVDATGKFLIPGLWDMHVHWYDKNYLHLFTANGVTGIRIMWGMPMHHEWRKDIESGDRVGPRLFIASAIVDGPKPFWPGSVIAGNEAEGRQAVIDAKKQGADFIKVYSLLPHEAFFAIADEAKKQGMTFAGHVPVSVSAADAAAAGQSSIEHLTGIITACSSREIELLKDAQQGLDRLLVTNQTQNLIAGMRREGQLALESYSQAKADALFAEFKKLHTWQCPTLTVLRNMRYLDDPSVTNDTRLKYMPAGFKSFWNPAKDERLKTLTPEDFKMGKQMYQKDLEIVGAMRRAGVDFLAGTDTGNPWCFPGFSLHDELGLLVQAGFTPMQALQAATINPARFMRRDNELGSIAKGKLADLVLLDANPLDDISNTKKINAVVARGRLFTRAFLETMLSRIEALPGTGEPERN
jgi:imidazolonepropionase-like amidohydrolase